MKWILDLFKSSVDNTENQPIINGNLHKYKVCCYEKIIPKYHGLRGAEILRGTISEVFSGNTEEWLIQLKLSKKSLKLGYGGYRLVREETTNSETKYKELLEEAMKWVEEV